MRLALHGGLFSGKTTIAHYLRDEQAFHYISYTDMLKTFAAKALESVGLEVTVAQMVADKEKYRPFIIELGHLLDFDGGYALAEVCYLIETQVPDSNIILDNVRYPAQMDILAKHGFRLLRVETPLATRYRRASAVGITRDDFKVRIRDASEARLPHYEGEITVYGDDVLTHTFDLITEAYQQERVA